MVAWDVVGDYCSREVLEQFWPGIGSGIFSCLCFLFLGRLGAQILIVGGLKQKTKHARLLRQLHLEQYLRREDIVDIRAKIARRTAGTAHMLMQRAFIRWPDGAKEIFIKPCMVQRTTASNLLEALDRSCTEISCAELQRLAEKVPLIIFALGTDQARANERIVHELIDKFRNVPNIILFHSWCLGHQCGLATSEHLRMAGIVKAIYCFSKLLRFVEHRDGWFANLLAIIPRHISITHWSHVPENVQRRSDDYIDWLCSVTLLRDFLVRALSVI